MNTHTEQLNSESMALIVNDTKGRRAYVLEKDRYTIGRSKRCSIQLLDPRVSRCHARLVRVKLDTSQSRFLILDGDGEKTSSTNGVCIDGKQVKNRMLKVGDTLWFGDQASIALVRQQDLSQEELNCIIFDHELGGNLQANHVSEESTEMAKKEPFVPVTIQI